jgi:DNA-binding transcriptional LysR family regulator
LKHATLRRYFRHGTLTQLAVFDAVARHQSFTRAGEELCLAQPTVSVQMKKLAQTVGLPLFLQKGRQMELTDAGRELHAAIEGMFGRLAQLEERFVTLRPAPASGAVSHAMRSRPGQLKSGELRKIG